jgi:hypothetical protein
MSAHIVGQAILPAAAFQAAFSPTLPAQLAVPNWEIQIHKLFIFNAL